MEKISHVLFILDIIPSGFKGHKAIFSNTHIPQLVVHVFTLCHSVSSEVTPESQKETQVFKGSKGGNTSCNYDKTTKVSTYYFCLKNNQVERILNMPVTWDLLE